MKAKTLDKILETDLYQPIFDYLVEQGYTVHSEVKNCDVTAVKGDELVVVEMKRSLNATLLIQATQRQRAADSVYVAILRPRGGMRSKSWKGMCHLLRRLELGLIVVSFLKDKADVQIVFHPSPFDQTKSKHQAKDMRHSIIREISGRNGDYNVAGSVRRKLVTAYRENSIHIACCLEKNGAMSAAELKKLGTGPKTLSILSKNYYGWFERVKKGVYGLTPLGVAALDEYPGLATHYRKELGDE